MPADQSQYRRGDKRAGSLETWVSLSSRVDERWGKRIFRGLAETIHLPKLDISLPMSATYEGVDWDEPALSRLVFEDDYGAKLLRREGAVPKDVNLEFWSGGCGSSELDEILAKATVVFGSQDAARQWLEHPAIGLNKRKPIDLLGPAASEAESC